MSFKRILNWFRRSENTNDDHLRVELQMHYDRVATLERLLDVDGTREAYAAAKQIQLNLFQLRRHPKPLTDAEKHIRSQFAKKQDCNHLKGGWMHRFGWDKYCGNGQDYNVMYHTFPNLSVVIKCLSCRKTWRPSDPEWSEAMRMCKQSTNTHSSSEMMPLYRTAGA